VVVYGLRLMDRRRNSHGFAGCFGMTFAADAVKSAVDANFELAHDVRGLIICVFFVIYGIYDAARRQKLQ
jgi:hypothetical protein